MVTFFLFVSANLFHSGDDSMRLLPDLCANVAEDEPRLMELTNIFEIDTKWRKTDRSKPSTQLVVD